MSAETPAASGSTHGEDALAFLQQLASKQVPFEELIKGMTQAQIQEFVEGQYHMFDEQRLDLSKQLDELRDKMLKGDKEAVERIERVQTLMTSQMTFMKQLTQIVGNNSDAIDVLEKEQMKQGLQVTNIINRQNHLATAAVNMGKNAKLIMSEIEKLKAKDTEHEKFQWKLTCILSIGAAAIAWLMTGDNFAKIVIAIDFLTGNATK